MTTFDNSVITGGPSNFPKQHSYTGCAVESFAPDCRSVCRCPPDGAIGNRTLEGTLGLYIKEAGWSIDNHQIYILFDMANEKIYTCILTLNLNIFL